MLPKWSIHSAISVPTTTVRWWYIPLEPVVRACTFVLCSWRPARKRGDVISDDHTA